MKRIEPASHSPVVVRSTRGGGWRLRRRDVDLWRVPLDGCPEAAFASLHEILSGDETERAARFYFERDRRRYVISRGSLRTLLGRYLGCEPADISFAYGANGKPSLARPENAHLFFNVAHSEGLALIAFTHAGEIGVDLEMIREMPDWEFIASTCFAPDEQMKVGQALPTVRLVEFFAAWTRQEARLKASGEGLGGEMVSARSEPNQSHWRETDGYNPAFPGAKASSLRLYPLTVAEGYAATLAVSSPAEWVTCSTWTYDEDSGRGHALRQSRRHKLDHSALAGLELP